MYVKITDKGECFSTTMEYIDGVYANASEWAKYNFYPKNEMVGELVKRTPSAYIIKIMDGIYVPMTRRGIKEISYEEFVAGQANNICSGMDEKQQRINNEVNSFNAQTDYNWQRLPDMRYAFRQGIIQNMTKLTCDFKRNIYIDDLEESAIIYSLDICLEYQKKSGRELDPLRIKDITNQICDVYMEFFGGQFCDENKNNCLRRVMETIKNPNVRKVIDSYYQKVNDRYNWS